MNAGKSCGSPPGSSHSPQWKPVSQRYCSCGAGSALPATRSGCRSLRGHPLDPVEPAHHRRPQLLEHRDVAVLLVAAPTAPAPTASPQPAEPFIFSRKPVRSATGIGAMLPTVPSVPLAGREVAQPLGGEAGDVVEERRGRHVELPVAGPAGALAGRAVGGDVAGVAAEAPHRRVVQPVDPLVVAGEACRVRRRSVCTTTPVTSSAVERARVPLDRGRTEAVRGEPRLERVAVDARPRRRVSTWPALSGSGRNGIAGRRCSIVTSPSGPSASPWVSVISVPAGPRSVSRTRPLMFWPRSTTCTPGRSSVTATGRTSSTARTGGAGEGPARRTRGR